MTTVYPNETTQFPINKITRWFGSMDYGFKHPNVFYLHAEDDDGNIYTTDEYSAQETLIQEHVSNIRDLLALRNLEFADLEFIAAGHDCFKTDKDGSTVATEYADRGVILTPVHIDRVNAWSQMQERLGDLSRGIAPSWFIHKNCENLITQIPVAQFNPKKPGDILKMDVDPETGEGGDDALEAARNGLVMALTTMLSDAKPLQMGKYRAANEVKLEVVGVDQLLIEMQEAELIDRG